MKIEETAIDHIRARPRFKIFTEISRENYTTFLKHFLASRSDEFSGNINPETAVITVKTGQDDYWKPCLALRTETEENKTVIRGVFGPSSAVWTFFMFLYFIFAILWMVFITIWFVEKQIKSNDFPWALPVSFIMLFLLLGTYLATRLGQQKAKTEMQKLRKFAEESITEFEK
ncbi:hypothetical protein [Chryseobacterium sp. VAUSW3]|uniref:hypothetical protein n=1 Tax=Chryseobacterium sp. VAUSW3 TaxID=2010998 RepID=UPI000B4CAAA0|nr:hypothetical protein [Chryseobacterium sp. VAUSW3]OWR14881.1 hypothetical protein CDW55_00065 [Chryseobacterium sp. VAUSW3]